MTHCTLPSKYIDNQVTKAFLRSDGKQMEPVKPIAIITYGPTGSGKSKVLQFYMDSEGKDYICNSDFVPINIDNLVESIPYYNTQILSATTSADKNAVYYTCRKEVDELSSLILDKAIIERYNIVYETTGNSTGWLKGDLVQLREAGYIIILLFPLVTWKVLNERLDQRELTSPRKIDRTNLFDGVKKAIINFNDLLNFVDFAYVYNNTEHDMKLIAKIDCRITHTKYKRKLDCRDNILNNLLAHESNTDIARIISEFFMDICTNK